MDDQGIENDVQSDVHEQDVAAGDDAVQAAEATEEAAEDLTEAAAEGADDVADDDGSTPVVQLLEDDPNEAEIERLHGVIDELQARLRAVSAAYQKQQGEVTATRERLRRSAAVQEELRRGEVVAALFEPVENLRRSLNAAKKGASAEDTSNGLELVLKAFMTGFEKLGLEEVSGQGAPFDPNIHEALTAMPVTDPALDQVVIEVFSAGYRIGSRLIAPAKVIVGAYQEPVGEA